MKGFFIILLIIISIIVLTLMADFIVYFIDSLDIYLCFGSKEHDPEYTGIVEDTIFGKRDIFCPKCKNSDCVYVYIFDNKLFSPFEHNKKRKKYKLKEAIVEEVIESNLVEKYKCKNCGYIFK